ncbi:MAG: hypothetical protein ACRCZO_16050 [Cetobacterium sp.]
MEDSRKQFEQWCKTVTSDDADFCIEYGAYQNLNVRIRGEAWQASRQRLEVVLPDCDKFEATWQYQDAAEERLSSEYGIKIKGAIRPLSLMRKRYAESR